MMSGAYKHILDRERNGQNNQWKFRGEGNSLSKVSAITVPL
jgi:hypothetical protein